MAGIFPEMHKDAEIMEFVLMEPTIIPVVLN